LYHIHDDFPPTNKNTAVKLLRRNEFTKFKYKKLTDYSPWCNLSTYHGASGDMGFTPKASNINGLRVVEQQYLRKKSNSSSGF